jgi:glutaredoxin
MRRKKQFVVNNKDDFVSTCLSLYHENIPFEAILGRSRSDDSDASGDIRVIIRSQDGLSLPCVWGKRKSAMIDLITATNKSFRYLSSFQPEDPTEHTSKLTIMQWPDPKKNFLEFSSLLGLSIIGRNSCPHTKDALKFCVNEGLSFQYFDLRGDRDDYLHKMMEEGMNQSTIPIIFLDNKLIGGCSDLKKQKGVTARWNSMKTQTENASRCIRALQMSKTYPRSKLNDLYHDLIGERMQLLRVGNIYLFE